MRQPAPVSPRISPQRPSNSCCRSALKPKPKFRLPLAHRARRLCREIFRHPLRALGEQQANMVRQGDGPTHTVDNFLRPTLVEQVAPIANKNERWSAGAEPGVLRSGPAPRRHPQTGVWSGRECSSPLKMRRRFHHIGNAVMDRRRRRKGPCSRAGDLLRVAIRTARRYVGAATDRTPCVIPPPIGAHERAF